jgi:penicillin-binding protein 2
MKVRHKKEASVLVIWAALAIMLAGMGTLIGELWELQVKEQSGFEEVFRSQSVRRVRLPAARGKIYDATGGCLADSVPNYCIAIYTAELRAPRSATANVLELVHEIWARTGRRPDIGYAEIRQHMALSPRQPLVAWEALSPEETSRWRAAFEDWTAPPEGSLLRRRIPGLDLGKPVEGNSIVIHTAELANRKTSTAANTLELAYTISERIGLPLDITLQDIKNHIFARRPLPLLAWQNIDEETMAKWTDTCSSLIGTDIYYEPARTYPEGSSLAHLIGFTREADAVSEEEGQRYDFDMRGLEGIKGLEGTYNDLLSGDPGHKLVRIDVSGFHHSDLGFIPPRPGGDLVLAIDRNIQRFAAEALAMKQAGEDDDPVRGAVVVLDPNNGDVLALVSSPTFDPNTYMTSSAYRQELNRDPLRSAINRAVFGQYPPGSTFKPIAALGILRDHPEYETVRHTCTNPYHVGSRRMRCWIHRSYGDHGKIDLRQALMYSCNVYLFEMAQAVGFESIHAMAREMGLGQYAGLFPELDKPREQKNLKYGNLPERAVNAIDLCNMSIGQGAITASPLQMAMAAAAIANGGTLYRPRLVKAWRTDADGDYDTNPPWAIRRIDAPVDVFELVRGGMYDVVEDPDGTAKKARVPGIVIAGKTGSAQYKKRVEGEAGSEVASSVHAWMISFAPYDFPRYAVAMLVEDGVSGGNTIAPRLSALYRNIFEYDGTLKQEVIQ